MPFKSMFGTGHASQFQELARYRLPRHQRDTLLRPGSLSTRLARWCDGPLPVSVVREGHDLPTLDEAQALGLAAREQVWAREVRLGPAHEPWVQARTILPLREMQGPAQYLRTLGTRPLGSVLFRDRNWRRSPFLIGNMAAADPHPPLPARRSIFQQSGSRLLVTEGFYPAYWQRLRSEIHSQRPLPESVPVVDA